MKSRTFRLRPTTARLLLSIALSALVPPLFAGANYDAVLAADGSGTFTNLQSAIASAPENGSNAFVIFLKPGIYEGQFVVPKTKKHLHFVGGEADKTILTYALNQNEPAPGVPNNWRGNSVVIQGDDFRADNITFQNTSGDHGQAQALHTLGDREVFKNCRLLGWQDTLRVDNGRNYFTNCYIEGRVDFIYGSATAVFDRCEIRSKNGGHITAASTPQNQPYGLVFLNCKLTGDPKPWLDPQGIPANTNAPPLADLGRPWRPYASVIYLNCDMGAHIKPDGWSIWRGNDNDKTARYAEYQSTGPGANPQTRLKWTRQLADAEAAACTVENILKGADGWKPDR